MYDKNSQFACPAHAMCRPRAVAISGDQWGVTRPLTTYKVAHTAYINYSQILQLHVLAHELHYVEQHLGVFGWHPRLWCFVISTTVGRCGRCSKNPSQPGFWLRIAPHTVRSVHVKLYMHMIPRWKQPSKCRLYAVRYTLYSNRLKSCQHFKLHGALAPC